MRQPVNGPSPPSRKQASAEKQAGRLMFGAYPKVPRDGPHRFVFNVF
jgi:hypothetical protein